jgi:anti-repressor protein
MSNLVLNTQNATAYNNSISIVNSDTSIIKMTSQEIADLVQSRHDDVKRSIERLVTSGVIACPPMADVVTTSNNRDYTSKVYVFEGDQGERDTTIIVAQLSPLFLGQVVDQWRFLKKQMLEINKPSYMIEDRVERAKKWIEEETAKQVIETQLLEAKQVIEVQQVDVDALERIASRKGSMTVRDAAKLLNMRPIDLRNWMLANKWTYSPYKDKYRPTAAHATAGHLTLSANDYDPLVRVTWKGLSLLAKRLNVTLDTDNI